MQIVRRRLALGALFAAESTAVVAVHRLGGRAPFDLPLTELEPWLRAAPVDALAAALRLVALAVVWWLLGATALYAVACLAGSRSRAARAVGRLSGNLTPRVVRVAVERALATSLAVGSLLGPAGARAFAADARAPRVVVDVRDGRERGSIASLPTQSTRPVSPVPVPPPVAAPIAPPVAAPVAASGAPPIVPVVVVATGDDLWSLSADALARATGRPRATLGDDEIARYWLVVCEANRASLPSGDVNLVYPGDVVVLPPVS